MNKMPGGQTKENSNTETGYEAGIGYRWRKQGTYSVGSTSCRAGLKSG